MSERTTSGLTRRQFCVVTGCGVVAGACGGGASPAVPDLSAPLQDLAVAKDDLAQAACSGKVNGGPQSTLLVGQVRFVACAPLFVLRDALGIYAMTAVCTHMGCTVNFINQQQGFLCPCHTSTYDFNGEVTSPPAPHPLKHYACSFDASDNIIVDTFNPVPATTRLTMQD